MQIDWEFMPHIRILSYGLFIDKLEKIPGQTPDASGIKPGNTAYSPNSDLPLRNI
jgi:hypothetical protein